MEKFIKKLIGRLEKLINISDKKYNDYLDDDNYCNLPCVFTIADIVQDKVEVLTEVKEIANQLAEEYNNDFCEWKEDKNFNWFFKSPHEGVGIVKEESSLFNFCPYCGKKIKVAPYQSKGE